MSQFEQYLRSLVHYGMGYRDGGHFRVDDVTVLDFAMRAAKISAIKEAQDVLRRCIEGYDAKVGG